MNHESANDSKSISQTGLWLCLCSRHSSAMLAEVRKFSVIAGADERISRMSQIATQVKRVSESWILPLMLFIAFLIYQISVNRYFVNVYDEGLKLTYADAILAGLVPYRDFWTIYLPGDIYLLAALFKIFGSYFIVMKILTVVIQLLIIVEAFLITKRIASSKYAMLTALLLVAVFVVVQPWYYFYVPQLLSLFACIWLIRYFSNNSTRNVVILGLITGVTLVFRQDMGVYLFLSLSAVLALHIYHTSSRGTPLRSALPRIARVWLTYAAGVLIVAVPVLLLLVYAVPTSDLVAQLVNFPISIYPAYRGLPIPALFSFGSGTLGSRINYALFYVPLAVYAATVLWLAIHINTHKKVADREFVALFLVLLGVLSYVYASIRSSNTHLIPIIIPAAILVSLLLFKVATALTGRASTKKDKSAYPILNVLYIIGVVLITAVLITSARYPLSVLGPPANEVPLDIQRAQGIYESPGEAYNLSQAVAFIQSHVPANQTIFVGNTQHQQIFRSNALFYFLADRLPATTYYDLHPGVATTAPVQEQIINDITKHDTKYVVLWNGTEATIIEPNLSGVKSGVTVLDDFVRANFVPVKHYGDYTIYERKDVFATSPAYNATIANNAS